MMTRKALTGWMCMTIAAAGCLSARGDEAAGVVTDTGLGSFKLDEKGTVRQFNLSSSKTRCEPETWRPTRGDEVSLTFTPIQKKGGEAVLAIDTAKLVKAGPNTVVSLTSPLTVDITEVGRTGVKARIPQGPVVKFSYQRKAQKLPAGWEPRAGEKATITFTCESRSGTGFSVGYLIDKIEKVEAAK